MMVKTLLVNEPIGHERLEGAEALRLYAAKIESNLAALGEQSALLRAALLERKELLARIRSTRRRRRRRTP
jgi:hypothetical protein